MKKIAIIYLSIFGGILYTGCSKESLLDKKPISQLTVENFYKTSSDAEAAVNAAYDPMQVGWATPPDTPIGEFLIGDIMSDDAEKGGSGPDDNPQINDLRNFRGNSSYNILLGIWQTLYRGIYRSNLVLEHVPGISMDESKKAQYLGEAKFCRAYYYFYLVRMFGGVPLITKPLAPSEYKQYRATKEVVYAQIEKDLKEAGSVLPQKYPATDLGRATMGAANGLLLRVLVYQSKWAVAEPLAQQIVGTGVYSLNPIYSDNFNAGSKNGVESVFEIQYMTTNGGWRNNEGNFDNVMQGSRNNGYGWGFNCPTQNFVDEFEKGDPRLHATVIFQTDSINGKLTDNGPSPTGYMGRKYVSTKPTLGEPNGNGPSNHVVLRYADIFLMYAEAAYHNGHESIALQYLNSVRQRARAGNASILPDKNSTGNALLLDIYHERRVELGLEALRFFDVVRQGRAAEVFNKDGKRHFVTGVNEIFPIPQTDIDFSGGALTQNPGY